LVLFLAQRPRVPATNPGGAIKKDYGEHDARFEAAASFIPLTAPEIHKLLWRWMCWCMPNLIAVIGDPTGGYVRPQPKRATTSVAPEIYNHSTKCLRAINLSDRLRSKHTASDSL
jgi:hypothetical protein